MSARRPARTLKSPDDLIAAGLVAPARRAEIAAVAARYAIALTPAVARLIDSNDPADPIARQYVPDARELVRDPAEDAQRQTARGSLSTRHQWRLRSSVTSRAVQT
jgi:L-lysine 2,3-aminomutase